MNNDFPPHIAARADEIAAEQRRPPQYLAAEPAQVGGYRAILVRGGTYPQRQEILETAADVAAAARLIDVPVLTSDASIRAACGARGVREVQP
jgi:hypothetical protein